MSATPYDRVGDLGTDRSIICGRESGSGNKDSSKLLKMCCRTSSPGSRTVTPTIGQLVSGLGDPELLLLARVYLSLLFYFLLVVTRAAISKRGGSMVWFSLRFLLSRLKTKATAVTTLLGSTSFHIWFYFLTT